MVAMSGGVDSAVAAAILVKKGYEVIGATMCFSLPESEENRKKPSCCGISGIEDARKSAEALGIKHYVFNFSNALQEKVVKNFLSEYLAGRTPNPCVRCNQFLKFDALFKKSKELSCDYLATGHYARITRYLLSKKYYLKKGRDEKKDQSYFLYAIKKDILPYVLFPLGGYTKEGVRIIAAKYKLIVAKKPASQEICFVPDDYRSFIATYLKDDIKPGPIFHLDGRLLGEHKGIAFYTIGQRRLLGAGCGHKDALYVVRLDRAKNAVILAEEKHLCSQGLIATNINMLTPFKSKKTIAIKAKIRYNHREVKSRLIPIHKDSVRVEFDCPQRAVTPGQSVVFYKGDVVLGGGIIRESIN